MEGLIKWDQQDERTSREDRRAWWRRVR